MSLFLDFHFIGPTPPFFVVTAHTGIQSLYCNIIYGVFLTHPTWITYTVY